MPDQIIKEDVEKLTSGKGQSSKAVSNKTFHFDLFPIPEKTTGNHTWIYGRAEREVFLQQLLLREKKEAKLYVGYRGEFMQPHPTMHFRAVFPAGRFPIKCCGDPDLTEICMPDPGVFEFTLSVADTECDIPCFSCEADVRWESSFDRKNWNYVAKINGNETPPHRERQACFSMIPEQCRNGLYDAGQEIFGWIYISHAPDAQLFVGESVPEAENRSPVDFEQRLDLVRIDSETLRSAVPLAFRYLSLEHAEHADVRIEALYTPMTLKKDFSCGDEELDAIWQRSVYTLQLCTRYFMIDGVKRDRLPWAGDLAVSLLSMTESFCEPEPIRNTLAALGSAGIRNEHINGISDYSLWYLINFDLYETYFNDPDFLRQEYFRIVETVEILLAQRLENGLMPVCGWVLIDWIKGDKNCALQIMFFMALRSAVNLANRMNDTFHAEYWEQIAFELKSIIRRDFYDSESGLFRCSPGKNEFLRHQNFLAVGSVATPEESRRIGEHLLKNELPAVGTPYMKSFEIMALIQTGFKKEAAEMIRSFWGGMVREGATTFWEAYGDGKSGSGLYDFYARPFGLSLCHAWGSAPAFLLPMIWNS